MNKPLLITLAAAALFVIVFPIYGVREVLRMETAKQKLQEKKVVEATEMYVTSCASCHGTQGEGLGISPVLNNDGLRKAEHDYLFKMIAHPPHGTPMAIWHLDEAVNLSEYQVEGLITLIRYADWEEVDTKAKSKGIEPELIENLDFQQVSLASASLTDPHNCTTCHEQPRVHADRFGVDCARCHSVQAWRPALLSYHTFELEHGGDGKVACSTCHPTSYAEHNCYGCHDHQPADMETAHTKEGLAAYEYCAVCHPTGEENEGSQYSAGYANRVNEIIASAAVVQEELNNLRTENSRIERCLPTDDRLLIPQTGSGFTPFGPMP